MQKTHTSDKDQSRQRGTSCHCEVLLSLRGGRRRRPTKQSQCQPLSLRAKRSNLIVNALQSNRAFALVISLGLVALITVFAIGVSQSMSASMRTAANIEQATEAYYAAEAALETGLLENKDKDAGYEASVKCDETGTCDDPAKGINYTDLTTANGSYASWNIQGRTRCLWDTNPATNPDECESTMENIYYIPYPGTGTAGTGCDPLGEYPDPNHACNWGKIRYGENIAIPLYATVDPDNSTETTADSNGNNNDYLEPNEWGMTAFYIKVRTPCNPDLLTSNETMNDCDEDDRYVIDTSYDVDFVEGETLMIWEITGKCSGAECYLQQNDAIQLVSGEREISRNSEIFANRINDSSYYWDSSYGSWPGNFTLINENFFGESEETIEDFLMNASLERPILNLSVIYSLVANTLNGLESIPYLEYQIELVGDANLPPSDLYQTIIAEGYSGNFKQSIEMKKGRETGVLKFVIQN